MKRNVKWLFIIIVAVVPAVFIKRVDSFYNASPCIYNEVCQELSLGTKKVTNYGYPGVYQQEVEFTPLDDSKSSMTSYGGDRDYLMIAVNTIFWAALFSNIVRLKKRLIK